MYICDECANHPVHTYNMYLFGKFYDPNVCQKRGLIIYMNDRLGVKLFTFYCKWKACPFFQIDFSSCISYNLINPVSAGFSSGRSSNHGWRSFVIFTGSSSKFQICGWNHNANEFNFRVKNQNKLLFCMTKFFF